MVYSPYLLNIRFLFQNLQFNVWTIYTVPSDPLILQNSFNIIMEQYNLNLNKNQFHIVSGDFKSVMVELINHPHQNQVEIFIGTLNL